MFKHIFMGAAALALVAGTSFVRGQSTTEPQQTVVQNPDGSQTVDKSETERTTGDDGSQYVETHHMNRQANAFGDQSVTHNSSESTRDADGSTHQETTTDTQRSN